MTPTTSRSSARQPRAAQRGLQRDEALQRDRRAGDRAGQVRDEADVALQCGERLARAFGSGLRGVDGEHGRQRSPSAAAAQFPARESNRAPPRPYSPRMTLAVSPLGALMRHWRRERRMSQLGLAGEAGVTQRHVSFVESGRANPSREMVLALARALDVPLRERNQMLLAAGYAPHYRETGLDATAMAQVQAALDRAARPAGAVPRRRHGPPLERARDQRRRRGDVRVPARRRAARAGQHRAADVHARCGRTSRTSSRPARR